MNADNAMGDPGERRVVNSNNGVSNILDMDASEDKIIETLDRCAAILKEHCGPQSGYAMILEDVSIGMDFKPTLFTRDGIRILSSVEFMSPMEKYIKDMLTYIGGRVDNSAKDGTTTSMLFSALFLKRLLKKRKEIRSLNLSFSKMQHLIDEMFKFVMLELQGTFVFSIDKIAGVKKDDKLPEAEAMKLAGKVAFMQALSSSGGNMDLAIAMKEIFEKSPRVSWEFIESKTSKKETGKSFQVEVDTFDSRIRCVTTTPYNLNTMLGTEYQEENVRVIAVPGAVNEGANIADDIETLLESIPGTEPVLLLMSYISPRLLTTIIGMSQTREKPITVWQYSPEQQLAGQAYPWELMTLAAIACIEPPLFEKNHTLTLENTFIAKKVHWHDTYLDFFGIVEMDGDTCLHPFYDNRDKSTVFYRELVEQIENILSEYRDGHRPDGTMYAFFQEVMNKLACVHRPLLRLGGPLHEQIANKEIIKDVQGAIMSSLTNGFMINGSFGLYAVMESYKFRDGEEKTSSVKFLSTVAEAISDSLEEVLETVFTTPEMESDEFLCHRNRTEMCNPDSYQNVLAERIKPFSFREFLEEMDTADLTTLDTRYPVAQPYMITKELLKRTQELLMKFINTNKIVAIGGVVLDKKEE